MSESSPRPRTRPPVFLLASHHSGAGLELQQLAERHGYTVVRTFTGTQTLERARSTSPDLVILDTSLPDLETYDLSRALRDDPAVGPSTPILLVTPNRPPAKEHRAALRAGVWEFLPQPLNAEEVAAKLRAYVVLKLNADRARLGNTVQDEGGLYTVRGLALRAQELVLQAFHHDAALACVAVAPVGDDARQVGAVDLLDRVLRASGRRSDAIGRLGPGEFAVVAPGTDAAGAVLLAHRIARAVGAAAPGGAGTAPLLRAGYDAVGNTRYTPIEPKNLLARATSALRAAKAAAAANWIRPFGAA
jgi:PleD family two-component response regulator